MKSRLNQQKMFRMHEVIIVALTSYPVQCYGNILTVLSSTSTIQRLSYRNVAFIRLYGCKLSTLLLSRMVRKLTLQIIAPLHLSLKYHQHSKKSYMLLSPSICRTNYLPMIFVFESLDHVLFCCFCFLIEFLDRLILKKNCSRHIWISLKLPIKWTTILFCRNCGVLAGINRY